MSKGGWAYIMASIRRTLYTGVTSQLDVRVFDHKTKLFPGFSAKYNCSRLVYFEWFDDIESAIAREKQIKGQLRAKKICLIESVNPEWRDLSEGWHDATFVSDSLKANLLTRHPVQASEPS